jgi:ribosomal protein S18 acetylase RimI-like enzyme
MKARLTTVNDAEGVFNVQKMTWIDAYPNKKYGVKRKDIVKRFADEEKFIAKTRKKIEGYGKDMCGWVVELEGKIVGFSATYKHKGKDLVGAIYVLPEYQGKGIGKILLQKVLDFLKDSKEIWLEVAAYNKNAINFYEKSGFHIVPETEGEHEIIEGKFIPTIEMKREQ